MQKFCLNPSQTLVQLGIINQWDLRGLKCEAAMKLVLMHKYQQCLNTFEGLVVTRIFELTKMNWSQTGGSSTILLLIHPNQYSRICFVQTNC